MAILPTSHRDGIGEAILASTINDIASSVNDVGYNVRTMFGAVAGSSPANAAANTAAFNDAIAAAVAAGGGEVYVPAGEFVLQPTTALTANGHALFVGGNNVTIRGAGRKKTKLTFYVYGGLNPNANWEIVAGAVQRGYGIALGTGVKNFTLKDLEFAGMPTDGGGYTNNPSFPANVSTGDGWDVTHKCVFAINDATLDNIRIQNCHLHDWRGEIVYYGGSTMGRYFIEDCELAYTNGDCISISGQCTYRRNELHHAAFAAIEDVYGGVPETVEDNYVHDCLNGINLSAQNGLTTWGPVNVKRNRLRTVARDGIVANRAQNINIHDNLLTDCGTATNFRSILVDGTGGVKIAQLSIKRNVILPLTSAIYRGIQLYDAGVGVTDSEVCDNSLLVTSGFGYSADFSVGPDISGTVTRLVVNGNRRDSGAHGGGFVSIGSNYSATWGDETIYCTVAFLTVTLPSAVGVLGKRFTIKLANAALFGGAVTIATTGGQTIDGYASAALSAPGDSITLVSNSANWLVVDERQGAFGLQAGYKPLTYGATIATDASLGSTFAIVATNGTAFTISNPTNPTLGQTLTYDIKNSSGGAMGAITWGANFLLAGAFTNPASTKRRTIAFYYDGTNWVETGRAAADI